MPVAPARPARPQSSRPARRRPGALQRGLLRATLAGALTLAACGGDPDTPTPGQTATVTSVRVNPATATVDVGATTQLSALALNGSGLVVPGRTVTWASQTPALATVSADGVVTGVAVGTATIAATADGKTGTATVAVTLPPSARCDARDSITVGQVITGAIGSTDCVLADGSHADKYILTLTEARAVRINMAAATLDAFLTLQNAATGTVIAENDDGNGPPYEGSRIELLLTAGRYVITATTFEDDGFGAYELSVTPGSQACIDARVFNSPGTVTDTLTAASCVLSDTSYVDRYSLTVPIGRTYTVTMRSAAFDAFMWMENTASGEMVGRNDDGGGGALGRDARISVLLPAGTYTINANSARPRATGEYTLAVEEDQCDATRAITIGSTVTDTLSTTGCRLTDGSYVRRYLLTLAASTPVRLDATSTQFDPYLILQQAGVSATLAEDDDSGPGTNAQLLQVLPAGSYVVTVTSATSSEVGTFTLAIAGAASGTAAVAVTPATLALTPGQEQLLTSTVTGVSNTAVLWTSSAPGIATVSAAGTVRAITAGTATITATSAADPSKSARSEVTVTDGGSANLDIPLVYVTQSMQTPDGKVPLVSGRATIARVFVRGSRSGLGTAAVRVRFYDGAALLGTVTGTAPVATALDEACCAADIPVPAAYLRDGATMVADVDPANAVAESNEGDNAWPLAGSSKAIRLVSVQPISIQLVPVRHRGSGLVGPSTTTIAELMPRMYPVSTVNVAVHAEYTTDSPALTDGNSWIVMLRQMDILRSVENGTAYYFAVMHQGAAPGVIGIATLTGFAGVGISTPIGEAQETLAHEFGHSFGRNHSPTPSACGTPADVDENYPRPDGTLGNTGYDLGTSQTYPSSRYDIMGYCDDTWASAYTYLGILAYLRSGVLPLSGTIAVPSQTLLINGSLQGGVIDLDPVFTTTGRPTPSRAGRFVAEGLASDGRVLFTHRFTGRAVADADPSMQVFSERVAWDAARNGTVASIRVRDDGGSARAGVLLRAGSWTTGPTPGVSLRVDSDPQLATRSSGAGRFELTWNVARYPAVIVRSRRTGEVLAIGARGAISFGAGSLADVDLLLSDGVSSTTRQLSTGAAP
ncbi:MAG: Ig-like domain-containing protein [Gemmatimonadaceae bacterium]|nr:Ig-like domain-containing protein [Gemmatimonadaceae bacterium]